MDNELELGVTEPLGIFDHLGWLETETEACERRTVELKNGSVLMAALIVKTVNNNHIIFNGCISPLNNLKFSEISTEFAGFFQIPAPGLA